MLGSVNGLNLTRHLALMPEKSEAAIKIKSHIAAKSLMSSVSMQPLYMLDCEKEIYLQLVSTPKF